MKKLPLFLLCTILFTLSACLSVPTPDDDLTEDVFDYGEYCADLDGGRVNVNIGNNNWSTDCVQATYTESITDEFTYKLLYLYAYNGAGAYFSGSNIEVLIIYWSETTTNGETEIAQGATFYDGFYNYELALTNPNYDPEEFTAYVSGEDNPSDQLELTSITANQVSGNLQFELIEEESEAKISLSGDFSAIIVE